MHLTIALLFTGLVASSPHIPPVQLKVVGSTADVTNGAAKVHMKCSGGEALRSCSGRLVLRARLRAKKPALVVGHARVSVPTTRNGSMVRVPLTSAAKARLRRSSRLGVSATAIPSSGDPSTHHHLVLVSASSGAAKRRCSFRHSHTFASNSRARLFYFNDPDSPGDRDFGGCVFKRNHALYLEHDGLDVEGSADIAQFPTLAGTYFAVAEGFVSDAGVHTFDVEVFDLRRERRFGGVPPFHRRAVRILRSPAVSGLAPDGHDDVTALVLARSGAVAWIGVDTDHTTYEVHSSTDGTLDSGPDVDPKSLTLTGGTLTWIRGGVTKTATL